MNRRPPVSPTPAERILRPIQEFMHRETSGGIVLLCCTAAALVWANSPLAESYHALWHAELTVGFPGFQLAKPLHYWINDGLMAIFFFVVGLEIKREVLMGELASFKQASLPVAAAVGGMLVPALLYVAFNYGGPGAAGWGIPMATDIAFALGVLALLGKRVPLSLKVFLTALAIVDDIGAVLVIALFYTAELSWISLAVGGGILAALVLVNRLRVFSPLVYILLGICLWVAFLKSGVHATVAGVLLAMTIPARARIGTREFAGHGRTLLDDLDHGDSEQGVLQALETTVLHAQSPLQRLEHSLHLWVAFFVMPVFALANAGVPLGTESVAAITDPISLGIVAGLVIGKQAGIMLFVWLAVKGRLAALPADVNWRQVYGVGWLAGIGFTMSLFIAGLAFSNPDTLTTAKSGIFSASLIAGVGGWLILRGARPVQPAQG